MFNLVPETTSADSQVFWSSGSFTNMLDYGAEYFTLRRLDMPRNFFTGNNCVAEYGQFPQIFSSEFRRRAARYSIEDRCGRGLPSLSPWREIRRWSFRAASSSAENESHTRPGFHLFLTRVS
jgi:hypothetical protein